MTQDLHDLAVHVVESNEFEKAEALLSWWDEYEKSWRPPVVLVRLLMVQAAKVGQAVKISYFLSEFLARGTPTWVIRQLYDEEKRMYIRLGSIWGVQNWWLREISTTEEGRAYLRSQWKQAK